MKVVYTAPNRAHHYGYARELHAAGMLQAFVAGFPRYSPRAPLPEIGPALKRVDTLQMLLFASGRLHLSRFVSDELAHLSKVRLDQACRKYLPGADVFLFYNGAGLDSARWFRRQGGITIVEAVNTHVLVQQALLAEEHRRLGLPWRPFHARETRRRVAEIAEADFILLPSTFVARSFRAQGIPAERLIQVPYPVQPIAGATSSEPRVVSDAAASAGPVVSSPVVRGLASSSRLAARGSNPRAFRVLYVGSISVRKGLRYLIEAFRQLKHSRKELFIVGPMTTPSGLEGLSMPDGVRFTGPLKGVALQAAYQQATVFCLPSIEDGFGLVLNEALSYGLPVIATENTGLEDLLVEGKGGLVVPIRDAGAIAAQLQRLAEDAGYLAQQREATKLAADALQSRARSALTLPAVLQEAITRFKPERCIGTTNGHQ